MGGSPPSTGRQSGLEVGSRARARTGSRRERRQTWACVRISQSFCEDGRRQRRGGGLKGDRADQNHSLEMLRQGLGCIYKLVTILFNMLYRALGTTAHAVRYNCFEDAE